MKILRKIFKKKVKVTFYMKSGNSFTLKFEWFEISKLSENKGENRQIRYTGENKKVTIDVEEIEAVIIH